LGDCMDIIGVESVEVEDLVVLKHRLKGRKRDIGETEYFVT
jgi:hypothetical protein